MKIGGSPVRKTKKVFGSKRRRGSGGSIRPPRPIGWNTSTRYTRQGIWPDPTSSQGSSCRRQQRLYERDKNHACVIIWSIGNEAGYGPNAEAALNWLHSVDS
ncbi:MAG: hypothetical protein IIV61_08875, partial [Oscillospiraceae bacterium]|nr:hypothetical protein [Oscillospiraceae bacterium]